MVNEKRNSVRGFRFKAKNTDSEELKVGGNGYYISNEKDIHEMNKDVQI